MPQDPSNLQSVFIAVAAFSTRAWLNMDQGYPINNRTVKLVVSCCVVSKQVEVSNISISTICRSLAKCQYLSGVCALSNIVKLYLQSMFLFIKCATWFMCSIKTWVQMILCNISRTTCPIILVVRWLLTYSTRYTWKVVEWAVLVYFGVH